MNQSTDADDIPILSLELSDQDMLYRAYMSFVKSGGLFVPTTRQFSLGDPVFLSLRLLDEPQPFRLQSSVIWIMPKTSGTSQRGIGIKLTGEEGRALRKKIEIALAGRLNGDKPTDTI